MEPSTTRCAISDECLAACRVEISPVRELLRGCEVGCEGKTWMGGGDVERLPASASYEEFFKRMHANVSGRIAWLVGPKREETPVVIEGLVSDWPCSKLWVTEEGAINWSGDLLLTFADAVVPVAHCTKKDFNDQMRSTMTLREFVEQRQTETESLYLKDWHLVRDAPEGYVAYHLPCFFSDDWINGFWDQQSLKDRDQDDYRFVYIGKKGTFTPLHKDVFRSYSWSTNIAGRKRWTLFPVEQSSLLMGGPRNSDTIWDIREWSKNAELQRKFPRFGQARPIELIQQAGETLFVPSGWYHQVENLEDTLSVNHNWGNACNVDLFWDFLKSELSCVEKEIEDCRQYNTDSEWFDVCQSLMEANTGLNYLGFTEYLLYASQVLFQEGERLLSEVNPVREEMNYLVFSLMKLHPLLAEVQQALPFGCNSLYDASQRLMALQDQVEERLSLC